VRVDAVNTPSRIPRCFALFRVLKSGISACDVEFHIGFDSRRLHHGTRKFDMWLQLLAHRIATEVL